MKNLLKNIFILILVVILNGCGGSGNNDSDSSSGSEDNSMTTCTFSQVGTMHSDRATGNINCKDDDGIRNTDILPAIVTVNGTQYRLKFSDNVISFDENVTITALQPDTNTTVSLNMYVVNEENKESDKFSVESILETNSFIIVDQITTVTAPILVKKTETTIDTTVGTFNDKDGVKNITVSLYANSNLTNFIDHSITGNFIGLNPNTTYYIVTSGESLNANTELWESKTSTALVVTTNASLPENISPIANAGEDKSVEVNYSVIITGSGTDSDGTIVSYIWKEGNTVLASTDSFSYTPTTLGEHTLTLTVEDDNGEHHSDSMVVTATETPVGNISPIANAGEDKSVEVNYSVIITGSGTDSDGTIVSYIWKEGNTVLASTDSFSYTPTTLGEHTLTLTVEDDNGEHHSDSMVVTATSGGGSDTGTLDYKQGEKT